MSSISTIGSCYLKNIHLLDHHRRSKVYLLNPYQSQEISASKHHRHNFMANHGLSLNICSRIRREDDTNKGLIVYSGVTPGAPVPPGPSSSSWVYWILGTLLGVILPFWKFKRPSFLELKREIDNVVNTIEIATEIVEEVANGVEKVVEEIEDKLPGDGNLRDAAHSVENIAKNVADDAHKADDLIHKVDEVEKEVETLTEPVMEQEKNSGTEEIREEKKN